MTYFEVCYTCKFLKETQNFSKYGGFRVFFLTHLF